MDNFDLKSYLTNNPLLTEVENAEKVLADTPDNIEAAFAKALKMSPEELEKKLTSKDEKEQLDESLTVTLLLLLPAILNLVGGLSNKIKQQFGLTDAEKAEYKKLKQQIKDIKEKHDISKIDNPFNDTPEQKKAKGYIKKLEADINEKFGSKFGKDAKEAGHKLHHVYTAPITQFLRLGALLPGKFGAWAKDAKTRQKVADIIYAVAMLYFGGMHMKHGLHSILSKHGVDVAQIADTVANGYKSGLSAAEVAGEALNAAGVGIEASAEL